MQVESHERIYWPKNLTWYFPDDSLYRVTNIDNVSLILTRHPPPSKIGGKSCDLATLPLLSKLTLSALAGVTSLHFGIDAY